MGRWDPSSARAIGHCPLSDALPVCRYKAEYEPSELLCQRSLRWVRLTPALCAALDQYGPGGGPSDLEGLLTPPHAGGGSRVAEVDRVNSYCSDCRDVAPVASDAVVRGVMLRLRARGPQLEDLSMGDALARVASGAGRAWLLEIVHDFALHVGDQLAGSLVLLIS